MLLAVSRFVARAPLRVLHAIGAALGWLIYLASPGYRRKLKANLAVAGLEREHRGLLRAAVGDAGKGIAELPAIWLRPVQEVCNLVVTITGMEHVETARAHGRGIIFLTPHLGCFEITAVRYTLYGPITVLYSPPKIRALQRVIDAGRARNNITLASADLRGVKKLLAALRRNEAIGILPDQTPRVGEGVWAEFFGKPAYTMTLVGRLQQATGADIVLAYGERLPRGRGYHIHLRSMPPLAGTPEEQARRLNAAIEAMVRERPAQYLWGYNRYKVPAGAEAPPARE